MAQNVIINGVTYSNVPEVDIPIYGGGTAEFYDTSDATLDNGNKMLSGNTAYANGVKYTGSIESKSSSDLTASGATVTVPAGYYAAAATKAVGSGSAAVPNTEITLTPAIEVNSSTGLISVTISGSRTLIPTVTAGYISSGAEGTISVSGSASEQLTGKAAATYTPTTTDQTIAAGQYLTGAQTIKGDVNLLASNIKSGVSIFGVAGNLTTATVSQDAVTKVLTIS